MLPDKSGIYKIRYIVNNKAYIGSTINLRIRWNGHISTLRKQTHRNSYLQNAFNKYGESEFVFEIIEYVEDKTKLIEREQYWIDFYRAADEIYGYNIVSQAGSSLGRICTEETKKRISKAQKGKPNKNKGIKCPGFIPPKPFPKGHIPWNKNKEMDLEYVERCKKRELDFKLSGKVDEIREKISKALKGRKVWNKGTRIFITKICPICNTSFIRVKGYRPVVCCSLKCGYIFREKNNKNLLELQK